MQMTAEDVDDRSPMYVPVTRETLKTVNSSADDKSPSKINRGLALMLQKTVQAKLQETPEESVQEEASKDLESKHVVQLYTEKE